MFQNLKDAKYISLDIETYDTDLIEKGCGALRNGKILGIAVGSNTGVREYYSINHPASDNLELPKVINYLNDQLDNPKQYILGANILYDLEYLTLAGLKAKANCYCGIVVVQQK